MQFEVVYQGHAHPSGGADLWHSSPAAQTAHAPCPGPTAAPLTLPGLEQAEVGLFGRRGARGSRGKRGVGGIDFRQLEPPLLQGARRGLVCRLPLRASVCALRGRARLALGALQRRHRKPGAWGRPGVLQINRARCRSPSVRLVAPAASGAVSKSRSASEARFFRTAALAMDSAELLERDAPGSGTNGERGQAGRAQQSA